MDLKIREVEIVEASGSLKALLADGRQMGIDCCSPILVVSYIP